MIPFRGILRWPSSLLLPRLDNIIDAVCSIFAPYSILGFLLYVLVIERAGILLFFFDVFGSFDAELGLHEFVVFTEVVDPGSQVFGFFIFLRELHFALG